MRRCLPFVFLLACADLVAPVAPGVPPCQADEDCGAGSSCHQGHCLERFAQCVSNGRVEAGEACDDGNAYDLDGCTSDCVLARCGDGLQRRDLEAGESGFEACDDGNSEHTDACTNSCLDARCGDGILRSDLLPSDDDYEACDDGNADDRDACTNACRLSDCGDGIVGADEACDDGNDEPLDACTNLCAEARCGDGLNRAVGDGEEECDDGNEADGDGCSSACLSEICGNNRLDADEACDDGNEIPTDDCTNDCQFARCGDGIQGPGEDCDDGDEEDGDGCSGLCLEESCGNNRLDGDEACDDGNQVDGDDCTNACQIARCGDGIEAQDEGCDDGNLVDDDGCSGDCYLEFCGNGRVETGEACDDGNEVDDDDCANTCGVGFADADISDFHGCGVHLTGEVRCWGNNDYGQTASPGTIIASSPTLVPGISDAIKVSLAYNSSCVLRRNGLVACWGHGFDETGENPVVLGSAETPMVELQLSIDIYAWLSGLNGREQAHSYTVHGVDAQGVVYELSPDGMVALPDMGVVRRIKGFSAHRCRLDSQVGETCYGQSCALNEAGEIYCWGANNMGQLGNNSTVDSATPVRVLQPDGQAALSGATDLAVGLETNCAIDAERQVLCWGSYFGLQNAGRAGALVTGQVSPPRVVGLLGEAERVWLRASGFQTAIFGQNAAGQVFSYNPREAAPDVLVIPGISRLRELVVSDVSGNWEARQCALNLNNELYCWGENRWGTLGLGQTGWRPLPYRVPNLLAVEKVALGYSHSCALQQNGRVRCWGSDAKGRRGDGDLMGGAIHLPGGDSHYLPTPSHHNPSPLDLGAIGNETLTGIWTWGSNNCVANEALSYWCWGEGFGIAPVSVPEFQGLSKPAFVNPRVCGLSEAGRPRCAPMDEEDGPQAAADFQNFGNDFVQVTGGHVVCGLHSDGSVWCWRHSSLAPWPRQVSQVEGLPAARSIAGGGRAHHIYDGIEGRPLICVITEADQVICWGSQEGVRRPWAWTQHGVDTENNPYNRQLRPLAELPAAPVQLALSGSHTNCVRLENGAVHCWGSGEVGCLGDGTLEPRWQHAPVEQLPPVVDLMVGRSNGCGITADGALYCWGNNTANQLGDGYNREGIQVPTRVGGY